MQNKNCLLKFSNSSSTNHPVRPTSHYPSKEVFIALNHVNLPLIQVICIPMKRRYWHMDTVSPSIHRSVFPGLRVYLPMHCNTNVQVDQYKVALTFRLLCLQRQTEEDETINQSWVCVPGSSVVLTGGWNLFSYDDRFVEKCLNRTAKVKGRAEEQAGKSDYHWLMRKLYNTEVI